MFYWKSANLIGSPTVFYSPIENNRSRVALEAVVFLLFWQLELDNIVGFGLQSFRVST